MDANKALIIASLSFVGGYVDTACFIALFNLFTAYLTGNLAVLAAEVVREGREVVTRLLVIPVFIATVVATALYVRSHAERGHNVLRHTLALEAVLLLVAFVVAASLGPPTHPDDPTMMIVGPLVVAAMAVQNAATRLTMPGGTATTLMTLNITQLTIDMVDLWRARNDAVARSRNREQAAVLACAVASFLVGAASGAFAYHAVSFWCLLLPIIVLTVLTASRSTLAAAMEKRQPHDGHS